MGYKSLEAALADLEHHRHLVRVEEEVDPDLEMAEIQRRAYETEAPAILFENVKGTPFRALCNLFGTLERARFLFRDTLSRVQRIVQLKADPPSAWRRPLTYASAPWTALRSLPKSVSSGPVLRHQTSIETLPAIKSWPKDGGAFITLPQVLTEPPDGGGLMKSNLGMYRVQLSGGEYRPGQQVGLHYQIHRGIGVHHAAAVRRGEPLRVSIFVGGPPAHTLAAVMPLPEGLSELLFAGMLNGRRFRIARRNGYAISTEADFVITGHVDPTRTLPEGPFGDHLGYYSLAHPFPVLEVENVYHRDRAIWPFTVVGRPPQEDTTFGKLIHEITAPMVPVELPGVHALHAVDAAGVHPLLLAIGSERYVPYTSPEERAPQELLTHANAILGFGQASLAKYLLIVAREDDPELDAEDIEAFFRHVLERVDFRRDLHFQTSTTIDTLDYSGTGLNAGSKVVIAAVGAKKRRLATSMPSLELPPTYRGAALVLPGVIVVGAPPFPGYARIATEMAEATRHFAYQPLDDVPLVVLIDDVGFASESLRNFLWVTFTRSNPSHDVHGVESFIEHKHWGCSKSLVIDARLKPHHAPPLVDDPDVTKRVDELALPGKSLHGVL